MRRVLPDTNAMSSLFMGDEKVLHHLAGAEQILMSIFVIAELYTGFKGGSKEKQNRTILKNFIHKNDVEILNATQETAEIFAVIKNKLRSAGKPIPINDIWIAAQSIEFNAELISYDKHFTSIDGLHLWNP